MRARVTDVTAQLLTHAAPPCCCLQFWPGDMVLCAPLYAAAYESASAQRPKFADGPAVMKFEVPVGHQIHIVEVFELNVCNQPPAGNNRRCVHAASAACEHTCCIWAVTQRRISARAPPTLQVPAAAVGCVPPPQPRRHLQLLVRARHDRLAVGLEPGGRARHPPLGRQARAAARLPRRAVDAVPASRGEA